VSAEWPRALIILVTFLYVMILLTWPAIELNRDPNSERVKRALPYFGLLYVAFLIVVWLFSS
jgi:hypothetical protein